MQRIKHQSKNFNLYSYITYKLNFFFIIISLKCMLYNPLITHGF